LNRFHEISKENHFGQRKSMQYKKAVIFSIFIRILKTLFACLPKEARYKRNILLNAKDPEKNV